MSTPERQLGRYRLLEPVGSGGMSVVYRGVDVSLERDVAVKVLHPHLATNPEARERFAREARAVARLHHPNIVEVYDVSEPTAPEAYLVTEFIRGLTLKEFLLQHPLRVPEAAALVAAAIASALDHAHVSHVLHRDVKPENVMVRALDGQVKLMDFGIAKIFDRDERMTQTGTLVGSPSHMAPEIIEGKEAHFPADIFAVGTLLYLMLTGELPFQAPNTSALLQRILQGQYEDPRGRNAAVSDALVSIVSKCLARAPEERFPDAGHLARALQAVLADAGLTDLDADLHALLLNPQAVQQSLTQQLVELRLQRAQAWVAQKRLSAALSQLNLLLALEPNHEAGKTLLASIRRRERRRRRRRRVLWSTFATSLVLGGSIGLFRHFRTNPAKLGAQLESHIIHPQHARAPAHATLVPGTPKLLVPVPPARPAALVAPLLPVSVLIRPYGYLSVDGQAPSPEALAQHTLQLAAGSHRLSVSCALCDDVDESIEVRSGEENVFRLRAQLKPAELVFHFQPASARVRMGSLERAASDTTTHPFVIESPRGPPTFRHRVEYEVSAQGFKTVRRTLLVEPGKRTLVEGTLEQS